MKSEKPGSGTSVAEVTIISSHGISLLADDQEHFLPFELFPWFKNSPVSAVLNVEQPHPGHLYSPDLDVDLALESLTSPEKFPLVAR